MTTRPAPALAGHSCYPRRTATPAEQTVRLELELRAAIAAQRLADSFTRRAFADLMEAIR